MVFHTQKLIALKRRLRRSEGFPIGSSLPSHGARVRAKTQEKEPKINKKKKQGQTASQHKKKYRNNNLYDA